MAKETTGVFSTRPKGATWDKLTGGDIFADTPFFAPGMLEDSEHFLAMPPGMELVGIFKEIRSANKNNPLATDEQKYKYACLETQTGEKFRVKAPGNLPYFLENKVVAGDLIAITYIGKEVNEKYKKGVHTFDVEKLVISN
jgi:hypothetical protein